MTHTKLITKSYYGYVQRLNAHLFLIQFHTIQTKSIHRAWIWHHSILHCLSCLFIFIQHCNQNFTVFHKHTHTIHKSMNAPENRNSLFILLSCYFLLSSILHPDKRYPNFQTLTLIVCNDTYEYLLSIYLVQFSDIEKKRTPIQYITTSAKHKSITMRWVNWWLFGQQRKTMSITLMRRNDTFHVHHPSNRYTKIQYFNRFSHKSTLSIVYILISSL